MAIAGTGGTRNPGGLLRIPQEPPVLLRKPEVPKPAQQPLLEERVQHRQHAVGEMPAAPTGRPFGPLTGHPTSIGAAAPAREPQPLPSSATAAFKLQFGREPASAIDVETARALDPTTTLPKYNGTESIIRVARIQPVPGGGLVRGALFIPQKEVFNVPLNDQGDGRGMKPEFAPDDARVSFYVDYENGIVVGRQNPSVTIDPAPFYPPGPIITGKPIDPPPSVKVARPDFGVLQAADGTVHLRYNAANAFAPPGSQFAHTVKGDLYIQPGGEGGQPKVAGVIGNFPAIEIYHDDPAGRRTTLLQDDVENHGWFGPLMDLPKHHTVGDAGAMEGKFTGPRLPITGDIYSLPRRPQPIPLGEPQSPPTIDKLPDPELSSTRRVLV